RYCQSSRKSRCGSRGAGRICVTRPESSGSSSSMDSALSRAVTVVPVLMASMLVEPLAGPGERSRMQTLCSHALNVPRAQLERGGDLVCVGGDRELAVE